MGGEVIDLSSERFKRRSIEPEAIPAEPKPRVFGRNVRKASNDELIKSVRTGTLAHMLLGLEFMIATGTYTEEEIAAHAQELNDSLNQLSDEDRSEVFTTVDGIKQYEASLSE